MITKIFCFKPNLLMWTGFLLVFVCLPVVAGETVQPDEKIRVAVMNFENNTTQRFWEDNLGYAAADEFVTQLFETQQFSLVERAQIDSILAEQDFGQSGRLNQSQAAELGKLLGVQLILTGSITKFSVDTKSGGIRSFGVEYSEAESNLDVRLIDTNTAEILFAGTGESKVRLGGIRIKGFNFRQDFDRGIAQEALRPAIQDVVNKIVANADAYVDLEVPISPAQIVGSGQDGSIYIDRGENFSVTIGQRYQVKRIVDEIRDASGNLLDTITDIVGVVEVSRVLGQSSICTVIEGEATEGDALEPIP